MSDPAEWGAEPIENPTSWGAVAAESSAPPAADTMVSVPSFGLNTLNPFASATEIPPAAIDRMRQGAALTRIIGRAGEMAAEGFGGGPLGLSDDTRRQMRELHILPDPEGSVGPFSALGASLIERGAFAGDAVMRGINAGIYGLGGIAGQISREFGESQGESAMAERDVISLANQRMIESGMGTFGRPHVTRDGVISMQSIGGLPTAEDFKTAASALGANGSLATEEQLRQLWWERGIHPHEAAFDASQDAFLHADLTGPNPNPPDLSGLATVTSSPVPDGAPRSALAKTGDAAIDTLIESGPVRRAIDSPTIDRSRDVPGGASISPDGEPVVYVDRNLPTSVTVDGATFDPAEPLAVRVTVERAAAQSLERGGMATDEASRVASEWAAKAERAWYEAHGIDQALADETLRAFARRQQVTLDPATLPSESSKGDKFYNINQGGNQIGVAHFSFSSQSKNEATLIWIGRHAETDTNFSADKNTLGPATLRATLREFIKQNPEITKVNAQRISGGRSKIEGLRFEVKDGRLVPERENETLAALARAENEARDQWRALLVKNEQTPEAEAARSQAYEQFQQAAAQRREAIDLANNGENPEPTAEERARANDIIRQSEESGDLAPTPGGADVTDPKNLPTPEQQPLPPPGSAIAAMQALREGLFSIGRDIQMKTSPMTTGSKPAMAIAKDFANTIRRNRWEWARIDQWLLDSPELAAARKRTGETAAEQRERMWNAADEESVARQEAATKGSVVPPVQPGFKRFYHGGIDPTSGGPRWLTPNEDYARHFRASAEHPNEVHYVDIPESEFRTNPDVSGGYDAINNYYINFEAPESIAKQLRPLNPVGRGASEHMGLATLEPEERTIVEDLQARSQAAWEMARDVEIVEGDGLPSYAPRTLVNMVGGKPMPLDIIGRNLRVRTPQMLHREHMMAEATEEAAKAKVRNQMIEAGKSPDEIEAAVAGVKIARDIRALPLATAFLEDAIAGRSLINSIQDYGKATGSQTVSIGADPGKGWFTMDGHPAFYRSQPRMEDVDGAWRPMKNEDGDIVFERVPIYVHGDFRGPLEAVLTKPSGDTYSAVMSIKGKTMGLIMNSPLIHNAVEWGRAMPAMPGKVVTFRVYFEGNRAKNDPVTMREAIDGGLVPIGHRFFNQDIDSIMEQPNLTPGRSWTSQVAAAVPGLFDPAAGNAVKVAIDKAGDFWHNTMLWDRVGDLQMGLYVNFRDGLLQKGVDRLTATRMAAHWANRYAGALPAEAMSDGARKIANVFLFSRSFTMGNLGTMKDMLTGLPRDVMAQIERDVMAAGGSAADVEKVAAFSRGMARRKAISVVALDVALMYIGNSILQSAISVLRSGGGQADPSSPFAGFAKGGANFGVRQDWLAGVRQPLDAEMQSYAQRFHDALQQTGEHPASLLFPIPIVSSAMDFASHVSSTYQNEPGKQDRIMVGHAADGTAIYMRNPVGKIGEEFTGYLTGPLDMIRRKLGTFVRPIWEIMSNDKGFGRKVYDPDAKLPADQMRNAWEIAKVLAGSQLPEGQISALSNLVQGNGDTTVNAAAALGPFGGVTFSRGAPGGPAVGELYHGKAQHDYRVQLALPDIRLMIQRGDVDGARAAMTSLGMAPALQRYTIRTTQNPSLRLSPRALRDFYRPGFTSPEDQSRMQQQLH